MRYLILLLFCAFSTFGQINETARRNALLNADSRGPVYFPDNAATPVPYEVVGIAGVSDLGTDYIFTTNASASDGTVSIRGTLNKDITSTAFFTLDLENLTENTTYNVTCDCRRNTGGGNFRLRLDITEGWTSTQSSGFVTDTFLPVTLQATTGPGVTTAKLRGLFTSTGDLDDFFELDKCMLEIQI